MKNRVKANIRDGVPSIGCMTGMYSPAIVEIMGYAGCEFVIIDDEHGSFGWLQVEDMIRAASVSNMVPIVRVDYGASSIQKALDRGALGVQVPMVNTRNDAMNAVNRAKYPPLGQRGAAFSIRAARYGAHGGPDFLNQSDEETLVVAHIETTEAVDNFEQIVGVSGIDVAFIGPTDLSVNMGHRATGHRHPEVQDKINQIYQKARELNVAVGTIATNRREVDEALSKGALFVAIVSTSVIQHAFQEILS